ncbi:MAG: hypothetical protein MZV63_47190 [Marinilabiliales bacterium]|nr:hypothetical protein [Marinilabiliales bacterium]
MFRLTPRLAAPSAGLVPVMSDGSVQGSTGTNVAADPAGTLHITDVFENYGITPITATYTVTPLQLIQLCRHAGECGYYS